MKRVFLSPKKSVSKLRHAISVVTPKKDRFVTVLNSRVITIFFMGYWHIFCVISFINGRFDTTQNTGRTISPLLCYAWLSICVRRSRAAAPKGTKSCRTQGDFRSSCLKMWMRCYRGLTEGPKEPKLRSKKADVRPENADWKLERADLRLERAGLRLERPEDWFEAWEQ